MSIKTLTTRLALLGFVALGSLSQAALVDGSGAINGWFTPFNNAAGFGTWDNGAPPLASGISGIDQGTGPNTAWTEGNNAAPLDYPNTPDYVPSPALDNAGEAFDQEFLGWRLINGGSQVQILGLTSINPNAGVAHNGRTFHVGDVFLDVDGDNATGLRGGYDFALTAGQYTSDLNDPLHPADDSVGAWDHTMALGLYGIDNNADLHLVTNEGGFGDFPAIAPPNNPFAVRSGAGQVATVVDLQTAMFNYGNSVFGANENGTWVLQWTLDVSALGPNFDPYAMTLHWGTECGNDYVDVGPLTPVVPEPATLALFGLGLASLGAIRRRRRA